MEIAAKKLIGLRVETKSGQYLGRVRDFEIWADALEIKKFYVRPAGIVKGFTDGDLIIEKSAVLSIDENKMTVLDLGGAEFAKAGKIRKEFSTEGSPIAASVRK